MFPKYLHGLSKLNNLQQSLTLVVISFAIMTILTMHIMIYLVVQWPEFSVKLPPLGNFSICPSFFKKFDYTDAMVCFPFPVLKLLPLLLKGSYLLVKFYVAIFFSFYSYTVP